MGEVSEKRKEKEKVNMYPNSKTKFPPPPPHTHTKGKKKEGFHPFSAYCFVPWCNSFVLKKEKENLSAMIHWYVRTKIF